MQEGILDPIEALSVSVSSVGEIGPPRSTAEAFSPAWAVKFDQYQIGEGYPLSELDP